MHWTLRTRNNLIFIALWGGTAASMLLASDPRPILAVAAAAVFGLFVGLLQSDRLRTAAGRFLGADTAAAVRRVMVGTSDGKAAVTMQWAGALVILAASLYPAGPSVFGALGSLALFFLVRDAIAFPALLALNRAERARSGLPRFRYHPDPIASRVLEPSARACPCCGGKRGWLYVGPLYTVEEMDEVCPWCIADGEAHARFDIEFGEEVALESGAGPEAVDELLHRTPWHFVAQQEPWPVHCGDFCALVGKLEPDQFRALRDELEPDLTFIQKRLGLEREDLERYLRMEASPLYAHLFRCLACATLRVSADFE